MTRLRRGVSCKGMSVGRNDSCPCGSGRKFKHCCLPKQAEADAARVRVRSAEERVLAAAFKHAIATWGQPLLDHAWEDFWLYDEVPDDMPAEPEWEGMFMAWFTLVFVPDPECPEATEAWPAEPIARHWLAAPGTAADPVERTFVAQASRSPLSVFEVQRVTPGVSVDVHDLLTGRTFHTPELTASRSLRVGDLVFARVVTIDGLSLLLGMAPYVAPASWHDEVVEWRDATFHTGTITREVVAEFEEELRDLYLDVRDAELYPAPPVVNNSDGDPLCEVTLTYALTVDLAAARERLLPLATANGDVVETVERDAADDMRSTELVWMSRTGKPVRTTQPSIVLGTLTLRDRQLVVEVDSEKRATAIARQIRTRFGDEAVLLERTVVDPLTDRPATSPLAGRSR